jgi:hypothetical protein
MLRIPIGQDMDGRVLADIFRDDFQIDRQPRAVKTHDTKDFLASRSKRPVPQPGQRERLDQLRSLGYLGDDEY